MSCQPQLVQIILSISLKTLCVGLLLFFVYPLTHINAVLTVPLSSLLPHRLGERNKRTALLAWRYECHFTRC